MLCKKCGKEVHGKVCSNCGTNIHNDQKNGEQFNTMNLILELINNDSSMGKALFIGMTLILVVFIVVTALYQYYYSSLPFFINN